MKGRDCHVHAQVYKYNRFCCDLLLLLPQLLVLASTVFVPDGDGATEEEAEFNWEEHLEETGGEAAPHTAFKHVRPAPVLIPVRPFICPDVPVIP